MEKVLTAKVTRARRGNGKYAKLWLSDVKVHKEQLEGRGLDTWKDDEIIIFFKPKLKEVLKMGWRDRKPMVNIEPEHKKSKLEKQAAKQGLKLH